MQPGITAIDNESLMDLSRERVAARRVAVVVLGMHRSGTSAITRMLSLLGCRLPKTLIPANLTNPNGHWESNLIAQLNDDIFAQAGTRWDDWLPVNARLPETLVWPQLVARARVVLREEFADAPLLVLKDPRICKLAGLWLEVLAAEEIDPVFVLPIRNPIEVARSLMTRDGTDEFKGLLVWLRHVLGAEAASRGRPRVVTDFAELLGNWQQLSTRLSSELGVVWPRVSPLSDSEISQFLTPDARHHVSKWSELDNNPAITSWVRTTYELLLGWSRHGEQAANYVVFDQISREFETAGTAFARPMLNADAAVQSAAAAEAHCNAIASERDQIAQRLDEVQAEKTEVLVERDALSTEINALAQDRDSFAGRLDAVEARLAQVGLERDERTAERDTLAGEKVALLDEGARISLRLGKLEAGFAQVCGERAALVEERDGQALRLGELEAGLLVFTTKIEQAEARTAGLADSLAIAHDGAEALQHRLAVAESTLRQREEELAQVGAAMSALEHKTADQASASAGHSDRASQMEHAFAEALVNLGEAEERVVLAEARTEAQNHQLAARFAELAKLTKLLRQNERDVDSLQDQLAQTQSAVKTRFSELSQLTHLYRSQEQRAETQRVQADRLRQIYATIAASPRWWAVMPLEWRNLRQRHKLKTRGLFDGDAYLARYPDVAAEGMDPLRHYILHGTSEGREA